MPTKQTQKPRSPNWGGARRGSGPLRRTIRLSETAAQDLRLLREMLLLNFPPARTPPAYTIESIVEHLIREAVQEMRYVESEDADQ